MKTIVITGSTRGIGYGMAQAFLAAGHRVVISGRTQASTDQAVAALQASYPAQQIIGCACDVARYADVEALWQHAKNQAGQVDIWINNAGISNVSTRFWELPEDRIENVVHTNLLGVMYASKVAIAGMLAQGSGQLYNMEGLGSNGMIQPGLILYGATKSALTYLTKGLMKETRKTPVQVGLLSPGMVVTDLLTEGYTTSELEASKRIFNILADRVETVAPYLVSHILANTAHGAHIVWLTTPKIIWRFMTARIRPRDVFRPS